MAKKGKIKIKGKPKLASKCNCGVLSQKVALSTKLIKEKLK